MFRRFSTERTRRGGMGFGFRGNPSPWPYIGTGRGGLPRCAYYTGTQASPVSGITSEQEIDLLKKQAETLKKELEIIESRMRDVEKEKGS